MLPAFGVISASLEGLRQQPTPSYLGMVLAVWSIGVVGYFVWAHHMFTVGMSDLTRVYFSCATLVIGVPTAVKIFARNLSLLLRIRWIHWPSPCKCRYWFGISRHLLRHWSFSLRFEHCSSYWPLFIFAKCYLFAFKRDPECLAHRCCAASWNRWS